MDFEGENRKLLLICEDDKDITNFLRIYLKTRGYYFKIVDEGKKALKILESDEVGLLLLDLGLPDMDGEDLALSIKNNDKTKDVPVILFSAKGKLEQISNDVKADGYIAKPFGLDELEKTIRFQMNGNS
jgi:two-component system KDP operon response regulator KdpE